VSDFDARMRDILARDAMRRGDNHFTPEVLAAIVNYYEGTPGARGTGEPSNANRVHRAHDTSAYPRKMRPLSGSWDDIDAGESKIDHVKVTRTGEGSHHLPTSAYRRARKDRASVTPNEGAAAAQAREDHKRDLLARVGNNSDVD
jgi:hypothetical protein